MDVQSAFPPAAAIRTFRDETCVLRPSGLETTGLLSGPVMNDSKPSKLIFFFRQLKESPKSSIWFLFAFIYHYAQTSSCAKKIKLSNEGI